MIVNEQATRIAAPAAKVWALFEAEDCQIRLARQLVKSVKCESMGLGSYRTLQVETPAGSGYIRERVDHYDPLNMEIVFAVVDTGGVIPFAEYRSLTKVTPAGPDACIVLIRSTFLPVDISEAQARAMSEANSAIVFGGLRALVAAGEL